MLGRCRLRRGVSLEVIVEEDDQAEVTYDHSPLTEEDEDDDDSDMEGSSTPNGEGDVSEVLDEENERRRRRRAARARRRTIVGIPLDRMRSVSCEALTLLDTSDLDSCHSEWDDDDQNSNYVTLNRPISRKRILQNNSRSDSDDSGVEYHSNEEDPPVLEMTSSNGEDDEQQHGNMMIPQVKVTQIDTDITDVNEPDPLPEEVIQEQLSENHDDELLQEDDLEEENQQDALEFELSHCVTPTVEETFEQLQLSGQFNQTDEETWIKVEDVQVADKGQVSNIRQAQLQKQTEDQDTLQTQGKHEVATNKDTEVNNDNNNNSTNSSSRNTSSRTNDLLENNKVVIVETTPTVPIRKAHYNENNKDPVEEELRLKRQVYNIRNKEVRLEELPTPNTVSSVKELFENHDQNIDHFESFRQIGRFRDIKSNPSSKMLRFSRSKDSDSSSASSRVSVPRSVTLPRLPSQHTKASAPRPSPRSSLAQRLAAAPVVTSLGAGRGGMARRRHGAPMAHSAHVGVPLRKPQVRGFNVLKALAEDPRRVIQPPNSAVSRVQPLTFHPIITYTRSAPATSGKKTTTTHLHHHHQHTHPSSSYMDRSDCESLSSDTSEDSGVSGGSSSTSSSGDHRTSSTASSVYNPHHDHHIAYRLDTHGYRSLDSYSQDPSFKWIDPKVMSKIRAKGTTVIFFGPKHKKNSNGSVPGDLEAASSRCSTPVFVLQPQAGAMAAPPQMAQT